MGCDGACAAGFDLVFIGLPLLSLYEIPMLIYGSFGEHSTGNEMTRIG